MIGLLMAPIYPALNSAVLSSIAPAERPAMVGLIVVFSALGGTIGSFVVGHVFAAFQSTIAFYVLLIPIAALAVASTIVRRKSAR
jgi:MFS family permease